MSRTMEELLDEVGAVLGTVAAWQRFKRTHDVASVKVCCCEHTQNLFTALDALELEIKGEVARAS